MNEMTNDSERQIVVGIRHSFLASFVVHLSMSLRILGIDPGLNITGYGVLDAVDGRLRLCEAGVVRGKIARIVHQTAGRNPRGRGRSDRQPAPAVMAIGGTLFAL